MRIGLDARASTVLAVNRKKLVVRSAGLPLGKSDCPNYNTSADPFFHGALRFLLRASKTSARVTPINLWSCYTIADSADVNLVANVNL